MSPFPVYSCVWLASGSPKLIVVELVGEDEVIVAWNDGTHYCEHTYPHVCLRDFPTAGREHDFPI